MSATLDTSKHGGLEWSVWRPASEANSSCVCVWSKRAQPQMAGIGVGARVGSIIGVLSWLVEADDVDSCPPP
jgi:hypothetical protein